MLIIFSFFLGVLAPMPPGIAYNPETKECGYYMGGDEYASYTLPQAWIINYGETIQNETGSHKWDGRSESIEGFCKELGYSYIQGNIAITYGERNVSGLTTIRWVCKAAQFLLIFVLVVTVLLFIVKRKKKRSRQHNSE